MTKKEHLAQVILGRINKAAFIKFVNSDPDHFGILIDFASNENPKLSWRSVWVLRACMDKHDTRIRPFIDLFIQKIPTVEDGCQRELIKLLANMTLTDDQEGIFFDECATIWETIGKIPSTRIIAFTSIVNIVSKYPELKHEIKFMTEDHYTSTLKPGIKNTFKRLSRKLEA